MAATCAACPHGFLKMDTPPREFIAIYNSNHAHVVPGDHRRALAMYCEFQGIPVDTLD
jgi:L-fucose isomerase